MLLYEVVVQFYERIFSVIVISIDNSKRLLDGILAHQHSVVCAPRFCASFRTSESLRESVGRLEHHLDRYVSLVFGKDFRAEIVFKIFTNHKYNLTKSTAYCIIDGVVHNCFPVRSKTVQLLQPSITAAHSGSENKKCWFHFPKSLLLNMYLIVCLYSSPGFSRCDGNPG